MVVVADTSPLTALLHLGQIQLLPQLYGVVYLPVAVAAELAAFAGVLHLQIQPGISGSFIIFIAYQLSLKLKGPLFHQKTYRGLIERWSSCLMKKIVS